MRFAVHCPLRSLWQCSSPSLDRHLVATSIPVDAPSQLPPSFHHDQRIFAFQDPIEHRCPFGQRSTRHRPIGQTLRSRRTNAPHNFSYRLQRLPTGSHRSSNGAICKSLCLIPPKKSFPIPRHRRHFAGDLGTPHPSFLLPTAAIDRAEPIVFPHCLPTHARWRGRTPFHHGKKSLPMVSRLSQPLRDFPRRASVLSHPAPMPPPMDPRCPFSRSATAT
jgi:hypothetical protein